MADRNWGYRVLIGLLVVMSGVWTLACPAIALSTPVPTATPIVAQVISESSESAKITDLDASSLENGAQIFEANCAGCHANGGNIIRRGKNLHMRALSRYHMDTIEAIAHIVTYGKRPMSAYGESLSEQEIQAVSAYVLKRAEEDWQ
ncbi:MAG: c-type cytochrome [Elainellaceae cyanobacterium]